MKLQGERLRSIERPCGLKRAATRGACPDPLFGGRGTVGGWMFPTLACALGLWISGCGGAAPKSATRERQYFTIMDEQGKQTVVPAEELFGGSAHPSAAVKILAIDRQTGSETWVNLTELGRDAPALARYIPRARTEAEAKGSTPPTQ